MSLSLATLTVPAIPVVLPLSSRDIGLADSGNYYVATTAAPGTGIIGFATTTTFIIGSANPYLYLYNPGPATIYPAFLRLQMTAAMVGSGNVRFEHTLEQFNKQTTIATALSPLNTNPSSPNKSNAVLSVGANVCNAITGTNRLLGNGLFRNSIGIINDTYQFNFGQTAIEPVTIVATYMNISLPFVQPVIPPGWNWSVLFWSAGTSTGPTFEVDFGFFEK